MDLSSINKANSASEISFSGSKMVKDETGKLNFRVFPQNIELGENEELGVEIVRMSEQNSPHKPYTWNVVSDKPLKVAVDEDFKSGKKSSFDIDLKKYRLKNAGEFGYRYVVYNKDTKEAKRAYTDSTGTVVKHNDMEFTVASTRTGTPRNAGPMLHAVVDSYNVVDKTVKKIKKYHPEMTDEQAADFARKNHVNKFSGTINEITETLDTYLEPYELVMTTPLIGGDDTSYHGYHPKNTFRISDSAGTKEDFLNLQKECFHRGKGYVADGAFTSQGYEGIQLNHAFKWDDSPFKYWFKNPQEGGYDIGVLSDKDGVDKYTGIRIVNPKGVEGYKYDPNMPSYIQFYDTRLASEEQLKDYGSLINEYDKTQTDDPYEITTWDDAVLLNRFEIDPNSKAVSGKAFGTLKDWEKEGRLQNILNPDNMPRSFTKRGSTGGTSGWDGSVDLVKMNLSNHSNSVEMKEGMNQARNYMYNAARYWTEETKNALVMDVAQNLNEKSGNAGETKKYLRDIEKNFGQEGELTGIYQNISRGIDYSSKIATDDRNAASFIKEEILNFPLESLEYSPELLAALSTPFITPRPSANGNPAASKLEIYEDAKSNSRTKLSPVMQKVYDETLPGAIKEIMYAIQSEQKDEDKKFFEFDGDGVSQLTPFGKYFLEMSMSDMMNFFVTEGLFEGDTEASYANGSLNYSDADKNTKGSGKRFTMNRLKIHATTAEGEAQAVAKKLQNGLQKVKTAKPDEYKAFKNYLTDKYYKPDLNEYKIAEAIVDKTHAGLNWRFDAAKDVGDFEEAKEGSVRSADVWDDVIDFWTPFVANVKEYNSSPQIIAEVTSLNDFDEYDWGRFKNAKEAERAFYEITGATTGSQYDTFFGLYPKFFGQNTEEGNVDDNRFRSVSNYLNEVQGFLKPDDMNGRVSPEFIMGSHIFLDNHDKPRTAHLMAVDAALFWSSFKNDDGKKANEYKQRAQNVLERPYADDMSSKAVAVAEKYLEYFEKEGKNLKLSTEQIETLKDAVVHLANGYKYGKDDVTPDFTRAEAFGSTPYEISIPHVIEQAETMGLEIDGDTKTKLKDSVRLDMVKPYMSKMPALLEMMNGTVGIATLYAGDDLAQTGCETKTKNWTVANRNMVRHDWLDKNAKAEIADFNKRTKAINGLHKKPGMAPLSDGTPVTIPPHISKESILKGVENLSEADTKSAFGFLKSAGANGKKADVVDEIKKADEGELLKNFNLQLEKIHPKCKEWVLKNIKPEIDTGAIYKYDSKGNGVISVLTSAYIDEDSSKPSELHTRDEVNPPELSTVVMKDRDGNLIAKPGTVFVRKTYDESKKDYVDSGEFELGKDGVLRAKDGSKTTLDSTVTYFYKKRPFYTAYSSLSAT